MELIPIKTPTLSEGDDLSSALLEAEIQDGDILVVSSKVVATIEGTAIDLSILEVGDEAKEWSARMKKRPFAEGLKEDAAFRQAVLNETKKLNGKVLHSCPNAMLTELKPDGMTEGTILVPNAGLDQSNTKKGFAIGWPHDPVTSVKNLREKIEKHISGKVAIILSDSCCHPRRLGVSAFALVTTGIDPVQSQIGKTDINGKELTMTHEATADQLATAANTLMGNADQSIPAVIIRKNAFSLSNFEGWVPSVTEEEDLYGGLLK